jgi:peptidyl-prolyl cis-trans isomerase C
MRHVFACILLTAGSATTMALSADQEAQQASQGVDPSVVFARQGRVKLTQTELDGAFSGIPQTSRLAYIRDGGQVDRLVAALLRRKAIAADAVQAGFDQDPVVAARIQLAAQKELAEAWLQHKIENAPEADYAALGREDYLADPEAYRNEEVLDVSHILIGTESRSLEEARTLADRLHEQLADDPSQFDALVQEYSDDPMKSANGGRYQDMRKGQMVPEFEQAAFALEKEGSLSPPVQTNYGFHIICLNSRGGGDIPDYEAVSAQAEERARMKHLGRIRETYIRQIANEPIVIPDGAVEIMAKRHFGDELELAPNVVE